MSLVKEFKEFALRGNVVDMAVGIIIGGAFGKIVSSLVSDVIMPPIGKVIGGVNFNELKWSLGQTPGVDGEPAKEAFINYGAFLQTSFDFLIVALAIFFMIKMMNKATSAISQEEEETPTTKDCPACCTKIAIKATRCPNCTSEIAAS